MTTPLPPSAFDLARAQLDQWGLGSLAPTMIDLMQQGLSPEERMLKLRQTSEYKTRFAGNEARRAKGLPVLSEAEYLAKEDALREQLSDPRWGLPKGFYDSYDDFSKIIGADLGAGEIQQRLQAVKDVVTDGAMTGVLEYARQSYGLTTGDLTAYYLDPERAGALILKQARAATIGAAAKRVGFGGIDTAYAEKLDALGLNADQAAQGFGEAAALRGLTEGEDAAAAADLTGALLEGNADSRVRVERAQNARRARFATGGGFAEDKDGIAGLGSASS